MSKQESEKPCGCTHTHTHTHTQEHLEVQKLKLESLDCVSENVKKIREILPNCVTETEDGLKIDYDMLKQELSSDIVEGNKEKYQLTWPGKEEAMLTANTPCNKTLRPVKEKSADFDNTKNIYIEGDNLEALKILQESYLNKIKCIYIDPPYNTGNDFIYNDRFVSENELGESGQIDEYNNRLISNQESNGKFHSDWLSMMYPRLKLARNLLCDEGVIFISIDENEYCNLKKICDEILGEKNFIGDIVRKTKSMTNDSGFGFNNQHDYILLYGKKAENIDLKGEEKDFSNYRNPDNDVNGDWCAGDPSAKSGGSSTYFAITNPYTKIDDFPPEGRYWAFSKETLENYIKTGKIKFKEDYKKNERGFIFKRYKKDLQKDNMPLDSLFATSNEYMNQVATKELSQLLNANVFSYPKPVELVKKIISSCTGKNDIILDFYSGSATTADAVIRLNAKDNNNRKFIVIQLPEKCNEEYDTICVLGEERIRRVGKKIKEETNANIDYGFRVYRVDSSNMKDVYYAPTDLKQSQLNMFESNIKEDRTAEDLLTQVILDLGLTLDLSIEKRKINNNNVYFVENNNLVACFDDIIDINIVDEICKCNPLKIVFKESSFKTDSDKINVFEKIKKSSNDTEINII